MKGPPPSPAPRYRIRSTERAPGPADRLLGALRERISPASKAGVAWRALLLVILAWFTLRHLMDADFHGIQAGLNLVLHEAGHLVFQWTGSTWLTAAGGTLFHLLCIVATGVAFWRQRDIFAVAVALWWAGTLFVEAAPYAADARAQALPLVTVGDGPVGHDWFTMLQPLGLLPLDGTIGMALRALGLVTMVAGLALGGWVIRRMAAGAAAD